MACVARVRLRNSSARLHGAAMLAGDSALGALPSPKGKQLGWEKSLVEKGDRADRRASALGWSLFGFPPVFHCPASNQLVLEKSQEEKNLYVVEGERVGVEKEPPLSLLSQT